MLPQPQKAYEAQLAARPLISYSHLSCHLFPSLPFPVQVPHTPPFIFILCCIRPPPNPTGHALHPSTPSTLERYEFVAPISLSLSNRIWWFIMESICFFRIYFCCQVRFLCYLENCKVCLPTISFAYFQDMVQIVRQKSISSLAALPEDSMILNIWYVSPNSSFSDSDFVCFVELNCRCIDADSGKKSDRHVHVSSNLSILQICFCSLNTTLSAA
jgi:hypothetical protein